MLPYSGVRFLELASYPVPVSTIEREDEYTSSVKSNNYIGGVQAANLLISKDCNILIHINADVPKYVPAYGRIQGFRDICREKNIKHEVMLCELGDTYSDNKKCIENVLCGIREKYSGLKKGIFLSNDTYANILINLLIREYVYIPDDYKIIGYDNSPIATEGIVPISTIDQQIDKIAYEAVNLLVEHINEHRAGKVNQIVHRQIIPVLICRDTTI